MRRSITLTTCGLLVVVLCLAMMVHFVEAARKSRCPAARDAQLDEFAAHMGFLGDHSFRVPQNLSQMGAFCGQLKESVGGIQAYTRDCLQGFTRQILGSLMKRGKQQQSSICQSEAAKTDFMQRLACLRGEKVAEFHRCMDASVARFEYISRELATESKLAGLCCSSQIFFLDVEETLARLCGSGRANSEASKFVQKFVKGTTGELLQLICEDHRTMEDCRASAKTRDPLKHMQELTRKVKQGSLAPRGKSIIPPLLEILDAAS